MENPTVLLKDVSKIFGRFAALRHVTLELLPARIYVLLGENGAGKSTLMRVMAGLSRPSGGHVSILGTEDLRSITQRIGYMAHSAMLYDEFDAVENLSYFASLYGVEASAVPPAITSVGLDPDLKRRVGQYSQGMRQRLSLARAILHDPEVLLLDEPFSNVDAVSARAMVEFLSELRQAGKTVLVTTHQPALLVEAADEFVTLRAGRLVSRAPRLQAVES